ncbi:MAG: DNA recombination/repair protein RecA, partial [Chloroflexi bacterium]|nr:DNA recombination/repair protein RecA [Chloroflexota bacterium]
NTAVIFTNQLRMKIGVLFGNPETTTGGNALKFYAAVRLDLRKAEAIKQKTEVIGNRIRARVKKNKVAPPFKVAEFDIMFDQGISKEGSILDVGTEVGVIEKRGSFYSYGDTRLGQGRENAKAFLRANPALADEIENKVRVAVGLKPKPAYVVSAPQPPVSVPAVDEESVEALDEE